MGVGEGKERGGREWRGSGNRAGGEGVEIRRRKKEVQQHVVHISK